MILVTTYVLIKFPLKEITNQSQTTTLSTGILFLQLLQNHYHHLSFTGTYDPKPQSQYLNVIPENKTKDPIAIPKSILGYLDFPEEWNLTESQPQAYTVYNMNQVTKTLLCNFYPDTFEVHRDYTPINAQFDDSPVYQLNQISIIISSRVTTAIEKLEPKYHTFLHKFLFHHSQLSSQK